MKSRSILLLLMTILLSGTVFAKPLKVYILVGQSNMQGHAKSTTLPHMASDPATKPLHDKFVDENGKARVYPNVFIAAVSERGKTQEKKSGNLTVGFGKALTDELSFGPELGFGITMYEKLNEPILIIKTAWGGKSLHTDFRPPSAGSYKLAKETDAAWAKYPNGVHGVPKESERPKWWKDKHAATGHYYRLMIDSVKEILKDPSKVCSAYDSKEGYEIAGMVWFQGWNDMVDSQHYPNRGKEGRFAGYSPLMTNFIRDARKDLSAPKMPFVIGVMGVGGTVEDVKDKRNGIDATGFRESMAAPATLPEFKGNVFAVRTGKFWDFDVDKVDQVHINSRKFRIQFEKEKGVKFQDLPRPERPKFIKERNEYVAKNLKKIFSEKYPDLNYEALLSGKSNSGYHYLGCGKIIAQIGEAFAKALIK